MIETVLHNTDCTVRKNSLFCLYFTRKFDSPFILSVTKALKVKRVLCLVVDFQCKHGRQKSLYCLSMTHVLHVLAEKLSLVQFAPMTEFRSYQCLSFGYIQAEQSHALFVCLFVCISAPCNASTCLKDNPQLKPQHKIVFSFLSAPTQE